MVETSRQTPNSKDLGNLVSSSNMAGKFLGGNCIYHWKICPNTIPSTNQTWKWNITRLFHHIPMKTSIYINIHQYPYSCCSWNFQLSRLIARGYKSTQKRCDSPRVFSSVGTLPRRHVLWPGIAQLCSGCFFSELPPPIASL